jgi:hypothetical protein
VAAAAGGLLPAAPQVYLQLMNIEENANLSEMQVGGELRCRGSTFLGGATFSGTVVGHDFDADGARFMQPAAEVYFEVIRVDGSLFIQHAVFEGAVSFDRATIGINLEASGASFLYQASPSADTQPEAQFDVMKVGSSAFFEEAVFAGRASFKHVVVSSTFKASGAEFRNDSEHSAEFNALKVGGSAYFMGGQFAGAADFTGADIGLSFWAQGARFCDPKQRVLFDSMRVKVNTSFAGAHFAGPVQFMYCDLNRVDLSVECWPTRVPELQLSGTTYKDILVNNGRRTEDLIALADHALYDRSVYANLESFYRTQGRPEEANEVFQAMRRAERQQLPRYSLRRLWSYLLHIFVLDGTTPGLALVWGAGVVVVGSVIFRPACMEKKKAAEDGGGLWQRYLAAFGPPLPGGPDASAGSSFVQAIRRFLDKCHTAVAGTRAGGLIVRYAQRFLNWCYDADRQYNRVLYSLDLFIPGISLDTETSWKPRDGEWVAWAWHRVQRVLGWIIIPIGIVSLTGIAKL